MAIYMIATHTDGREIVGVRLYDSKSNQIKDVPLNNILHALGSGVKIENLSTSINTEGKTVLNGTNGSIERYTSLLNNRPFKVCSIVILEDLGNNRFNVITHEGDRHNAPEIEVIKRWRTGGLANGKVVTKDGKQFISAIRGRYTVSEKSTGRSDRFIQELSGANLYQEIDTTPELYDICSKIGFNIPREEMCFIGYDTGGSSIVMRISEVANNRYNKDSLSKPFTVRIMKRRSEPRLGEMITFNYEGITLMGAYRKVDFKEMVEDMLDR